MTMNHSAYMKKTKKMSVESLRFVIQDCLQALEANPECEKAWYYADEINYCSMELGTRGIG